MSGSEMSTPTVVAPRWASLTEFSPEPQPRSRTARPATSPRDANEYSSGNGLSGGGLQYLARFAALALNADSGVSSASSALRSISARSQARWFGTIDGSYR